MTLEAFKGHDAAIIAAVLSALRKNKGITQAQLAASVGVSPSNRGYCGHSLEKSTNSLKATEAAQVVV